MKRLRKIKNSRKNRLLIVGSLLFIIGISIVSFHFITKFNIQNEEKKAIEEFYIQEEKVENNETTIESENKAQGKTDYIGILKIPKINLIRGLVSPDSKYNNVDYNIQIIDGSDMPNVTNGCFILAAHSGNASISYFKNLDKLSVGDSISLDYANNTYNYKIVNIYEVEKTGKVKIEREYDKTTLVLITCKHNTNKQIVLVANLMEESE